MLRMKRQHNFYGFFLLSNCYLSVITSAHLSWGPLRPPRASSSSPPAPPPPAGPAPPSARRPRWPARCGGRSAAGRRPPGSSPSSAPARSGQGTTSGRGSGGTWTWRWNIYGKLEVAARCQLFGGIMLCLPPANWLDCMAFCACLYVVLARICCECSVKLPRLFSKRLSGVNSINLQKNLQ